MIHSRRPIVTPRATPPDLRASRRPRIIALADLISPAGRGVKNRPSPVAPIFTNQSSPLPDSHIPINPATHYNHNPRTEPPS